MLEEHQVPLVIVKNGQPDIAFDDVLQKLSLPGLNGNSLLSSRITKEIEDIQVGGCADAWVATGTVPCSSPLWGSNGFF